MNASIGHGTVPLSGQNASSDPPVGSDVTQHQEQGWDSVESYFECITTCSLDDGECITHCVETLREHH